jgi:hypothetical protein
MVIKWTLEKLQEEALKYGTRGEFSKGSPSAYQSAYKNDMLDIVCDHMKAVRKSWSRQSIISEAIKYQTRGLFLSNNNSAYNAARKLNILDEVCSHMLPSLTSSYLVEELQKESKKYNTRDDFAKNSPSAYNVARKRKILDELCSHMKMSGSSSEPEVSLLNSIKNRYPKTQKLRDTRVKISGKTHIKGFEIDIYIPELRKGIEFDGTYWHSEEGLKRSRVHWPQEDIDNYSKIKDEWFASKGIKILHIKEHDWNKNKNDCISQCLEFLSSDKELAA